MTDLGDTLLNLVLFNEYDKLVELLPTISDVDLFLINKPILHRALHNHKIFQLLINRKFDLTISYQVGNVYSTILELALTQLHDCVPYILAKYDTKTLYKELKYILAKNTIVKTYVSPDKIYKETYDLTIIDVAVKYGLFDLLLKCHVKNLTFVQRHINIAAEYGHLNIVKWLYENHKNECFSNNIIVFAAKGGYLDMVVWLYENCQPQDLNNAVDEAACGGHLHVLKWICNHGDGYTCTANTLGVTAKNGYVDIVKFILESNIVYTIYDLKSAINATTNNDIKKMLIDELHKKL